MFKGEVILTAAEFALFFEGADLQKRFIDSPAEIRKYSDKNLCRNGNELQGPPV
jgi:hypothetical protein